MVSSSAGNRSYSSTAITTTAGRLCLATATGWTRAGSIGRAEAALGALRRQGLHPNPPVCQGILASMAEHATRPISRTVVKLVFHIDMCIIFCIYVFILEKEVADVSNSFVVSFHSLPGRSRRDPSRTRREVRVDQSRISRIEKGEWRRRRNPTSSSMHCRSSARTARPTTRPTPPSNGCSRTAVLLESRTGVLEIAEETLGRITQFLVATSARGRCVARSNDIAKRCFEPRPS